MHLKDIFRCRRRSVVHPHRQCKGTTFSLRFLIICSKLPVKICKLRKKRLKRLKRLFTFSGYAQIGQAQNIKASRTLYIINLIYINYLSLCVCVFLKKDAKTFEALEAPA